MYRIERIPIEEEEVKNESSLHSHAVDRELDVDSIDFLKEYTKFSDDNLKTFNKYTYKFYDSNKVGIFYCRFINSVFKTRYVLINLYIFTFLISFSFFLFLV